MRPGRVAAALALALFAAALWAPALGSGWLGDDFSMLRTVGRVDGPAWAFTHDDVGRAAGHGANYRPLWVLWNWAGVKTSGGRPAVLHAASLALYALVVLLVLGVLRLVLPPPGAWAGVAAFAAMPRHGESVGWITGSHDLLCAAFGLGGVLCALRRRPVLAGALVLAATLAKEEAVVLPVLVLLLGWVRRERAPWRAALAPLAGVAVALLARTVVVGGIGGYTQQALTPWRAVGSIASLTVGAFSPPQLAVLHHVVLLAVPLAFALTLLWAVHRAGAPRAAVAGLSFFLVALLPALNVPLDLNTGNGDRLLLVPSVGLALCLGAVATTRRARLVLAPLVVAGAVLSLLSALDFRGAGRITRDFTARAAALGPRGGELVVLDLPEAYRTAPVFTTSADVAIARAGRSDLRVVLCLAVHPRRRAPGLVRFRRGGGGVWVGRAAASAPFDRPVFGALSPISASCSVSARSAGGWTGAALAARAAPGAAPGPRRVVFWDGSTLVPAG